MDSRLPADDPPARSRGLTRFLRGTLVWALAIAIAFAAIGGVLDASLLATNGAGVRAALTCGLATASLGVLVALPLAPCAAALAAITSAIARTRGWTRHLWPLPIAAVAVPTAIFLTSAHLRYNQGDNTYVMIGFAVVMVVLAGIARMKRRRLAIGAAVLVLVVAGYADVRAHAVIAEVDDLAAIVSVTASLAAVPELRGWLLRVRPRRALLALMVSAGAAVALLFAVERISPGWRVRAWQHARYEERLARTLRGFIDFDLDGFSPIPWGGGDCDDFDPTRNPLARESPGRIDANCNGVTPSEHPTDEDRGLLHPEGEPHLALGEVDRVLMITIDCLRYDAWRPRMMPRLSALATRGLVFTRAYAAGSRTRLSFPLLERGWDDGPSIVSALTRAGIKVDLVLGFNNSTVTDAFLGDFPSVDQPREDHGRFTAEETTDRAIARFEAARGTRQYLWVHYYDMHDPIELEAARTRAAAPPDDLPEFAAYLEQSARIDRELGRLLDVVEQGGWAKTVVVVTGDHGEGFGQRHGVRFHGISGYDEIVHVPAILIAPGIRAGSHEGLVSHRDVPATILGAFGLEALARQTEVFGRSWLRLRAAPEAALHRFVVTRSARTSRRGDRQMPMAAIVEGDLKLIETFEDGLLEMYDLTHDPAEGDDLVPEGSSDVERLRKDLALYRDIDRWP